MSFTGGLIIRSRVAEGRVVIDDRRQIDSVNQQTLEDDTIDNKRESLELRLKAERHVFQIIRKLDQDID